MPDALRSCCYSRTHKCSHIASNAIILKICWIFACLRKFYSSAKASSNTFHLRSLNRPRSGPGTRTMARSRTSTPTAPWCKCTGVTVNETGIGGMCLKKSTNIHRFVFVVECSATPTSLYNRQFVRAQFTNVYMCIPQVSVI